MPTWESRASIGVAANIRNGPVRNRTIRRPICEESLQSRIPSVLISSEKYRLSLLSAKWHYAHTHVHTHTHPYTNRQGNLFIGESIEPSLALLAHFVRCTTNSKTQIAKAEFCELVPSWISRVKLYPEANLAWGNFKDLHFSFLPTPTPRSPVYRTKSQKLTTKKSWLLHNL